LYFRVCDTEHSFFFEDESILNSPTGVTNATGITTAVSSVTLNRYEREESMFMIKFSANETLFLIGWDQEGVREADGKDKTKYEPVFQLSASVLVMFQSTENLDSLGKSIIHVSFDKCWTSLVPEFSVLTLRKCKPIISPFAYEFRSVKSTANFGVVASQEFALDSDSIEVSIDRHSLATCLDIARDFSNRCQSFGKMIAIDSPETKIRGLKSRASPATTIDFNLQPSSLILLGESNSNSFSEPLLNFKCEVNGKIGGSSKVMSGELKANTSVFYFSKNVNDWAHLIERLQVSIELHYGVDNLVSYVFRNTQHIDFMQDSQNRISVLIFFRCGLIASFSNFM